MLKLEKMLISGFKSFSDRTEIRFPDGVTAVVGPNGCGKSNLGDAINWVLGEQSPKNLRGKQMADVIFKGTAKKKPKGMAEVSLYLRNTDPNVPEERKRIVLTRRLFRSGESEYLLNGARSRLKLIQELLREEHVGAKTYATIEQGRINRILNAKPKDRRLIIEDAAGISGIKHKRRLAELKLESTRANLLRVNDIISEVKRQINSLKRQAAKARRYGRIRDDLRLRERTLFGYRTREMDAALARLKEAQAAAAGEETEAAANLARAEAAISKERLSLEEADQGFREAADSLHNLEIEIDRQESSIRHARERISEANTRAAGAEEEAERLAGRKSEILQRAEEHRSVLEEGRAEIEELQSGLGAGQESLRELNEEILEAKEELDRIRRVMFDSMNRGAESRNRKRAVEEAIERNVAERASLEEELGTVLTVFSRLEEESDALGREFRDHRSSLEEIAGRHRQHREKLESVRTRLASNTEALASTREKEQSARARLKTLQDVATRFAGVSDGVGTLLTSGAGAGVRTRGVVADYVEAGEEFEALAESYLAGILPAVILEDASDARTAAEMLRRENAGRTRFVCRSQPAGAMAVGVYTNGNLPAPPEIMDDPRVVGRLKNKIKLHAGMSAVRNRIGDAVVVDTLETALELHARCPTADYLTQDGEIVFASGVVSAGGAGKTRNGLLAHNRQTQQTRIELEKLEIQVRELDTLVAADRKEASELEARVLEERMILEEAGRRGVELELKTQRAVEEKAKSSRQTEVLKSELAARREESARLQEEMATVTRRVAELEEEHAGLEAKRRAGAESLERLEAGLQRRNEQVAQQRAALAARIQKQESAEREQQRLEEAIADLNGRIETQRTIAAQSRSAAEEALQWIERTEVELASGLELREEKAGALQEMESAIQERRQTLSLSEGELHRLKAGMEKIRDRSRTAEMELTRAVSDRRHLEELCRQELGCSAKETVEALERLEKEQAAEQGDPAQAPDLEALAGEVEELRRKIDSIGPVNMMAIEEFTDLEERYAFLTEQKADLEQSMESLQDTIRKINRTSRERFAVAFEAIRNNYREIFAKLFNGGRADLRLEEGEDVLESGIEILAQPPGKRLGSVQLLSGGEKSMSAIALLFAIFRFHPSPFCLLDEVDAALDDLNVGRFTRMVSEYAGNTQFILVTHNKVSMESANLLYGVTMEEPGVSKLVSLSLD